MNGRAAAHDSGEESTGILYAALAYTLWGILPLYWASLRDVSAFQVAIHRSLWCAVTVAGLLAFQGNLPRLLTIARTPRFLATLALTSALISSNWLLFIYAVTTNQLVEASLGYYITPVISFALGYFMFGEKLSRVRLCALALGTLAVLVKAVAGAHLSWIALSLASTFACYGWLRKRVPVAALDGLGVETAVMLPITLGFVVWWSSHGASVFTMHTPLRDALLIGGGPLTAIPLVLFAAAARRVRLSTLGVLQYIAPSINLAVAVFAFGEAFTAVDVITFVLVWAAIAVIGLEGRNWSVPAWLRVGISPRGSK